MFILNNKPLQVGIAFKHNNIQYPNNWLQLSTSEEKAAIGIEWIADPEPFDDRFYWSAGHAKDLDQCKAMLIAQVKQTAAALLAPTDWKIIRFTETGTAVDTATSEYRIAVRAASNANEAAIDECDTVDELAALQLTWTEGE
jgi:hypothetical protein